MNDLLHRFDEIKKELVTQRNETWAIMEAQLRKENAILGKELGLEPRVEKELISMCKLMWERGYHNGAHNMILKIIEKLGLEGALDKVMRNYLSIRAKKIQEN